MDFNINKTLRILRQFHNLDKRDLSFRLGMRKDFLCAIEKSKVSITLEMLNSFSSVFSIDVKRIIHLSEYLHNQYIKKSNSNLINSGFCDKSIAVIRWLERGENHRARNKHHLRELQF